MLHVPVLRGGKPYRSLDQKILADHRDGREIAIVSYANTGLIVKDIDALENVWQELRALSMEQIVEIFRHAGELFAEGELPVGEDKQTAQQFVTWQAATTGMPETMCRKNMEKIVYGFTHIDEILSGLAGIELSLLDRGYGRQHGKVVAYSCQARSFGAVLPNNSPGVNTLWLPVPALRVPVVLKPGAQDPWTPLRACQALIKAGYPAAAINFYPTDHGGGSAILVNCDRGMVFGDVSTVGVWHRDPRIEVHGPGYSKVLLGEDIVDDWPQYLDVIVASIVANGGRSCVNASCVWTPRHGREIAEAIGQRMASVTAKPLDDPQAGLAAFPNTRIAEAINAAIENGLRAGGEDLARKYRGNDRFAKIAGSTFLQPTLIWCDTRNHPLAHREFLFPYASIVEIPAEEMVPALDKTLVVTAITEDPQWEQQLLNSPNIDRLNIGPVATWEVDWQQPHEGNLFHLLYQRLAFLRAGGIS